MKGVNSSLDEVERQLVIDAISGDILSFQKLVEIHQKKIYNIVFRMINNEEDAKDLTQDILVKAYKNMDKFRLDSSFGTWLYRIATNTCLDELRKRKKKYIEIPLTIDDAESDKPLKEYAIDNKGPDVQVLKKERQRVISEAIKSLPPDYRKVIVLRDIQGFSYEEISKICDINIGTIKSRINRGRSQLRDQLMKYKELFEFDDV